MSEKKGTIKSKAYINHANRLKMAITNHDDDLVKLSTRDAYFASLADWYKEMAHMKRLMSYMYINYNCQIMAQLQRSRSMMQQQRIRRPQFQRFHWYNQQEQWQIVRHYGGRDAIAASFWKRIAAEMIDAIIMLTVKIILLSILFYEFQFDFKFVFGKNTNQLSGIFLSAFDVSIDFVKLSSDFIAIIILTKFMMCIYDCLWITLNSGATPGKQFMGLRVLYVEAVVPRQRGPRQLARPIFSIFQVQRQPCWVKLYPGESPTLLRSFIRSVAKHIVITLFFPTCFILIFLRNNRTTYDVISKTIVVEARPQLLPGNARGGFGLRIARGRGI